jgi:phosphate transport system substrate-binding protein
MARSIKTLLTLIRRQIKMKPILYKSRFLVIVLISMVALTLAACTSAAAEIEPTAIAAPQTALTISGSGGASVVLKFLAEAYKKQHSDLAFEFLSGSSTGGGVKGVLDGVLDLGAMGRSPKDSELADGIKYFGFATERIVIVTSADLSITELTSQQVKDIFLGQISNWSEVGGPDAPINVLARDEEETTTQVLRKELLGDGAFAAGTVVFTSASDMNSAITQATKAIGFLSYGAVRLENLKAHTLVIDGLDPADVKSKYPYTRQLGVAYVPANAAKVQSFLDFMVSPEAQTLLAEKGITPPQ